MLTSFTANCQISLDSIWQQQVIEKYKKMDNYTFSITTNSTVRGQWIDSAYIDALQHFTKFYTLHIERQNGEITFMGCETENVISYTQNNINTNIDKIVECIIILN